MKYQLYIRKTGIFFLWYDVFLGDTRLARFRNYHLAFLFCEWHAKMQGLTFANQEKR